MTSRQSRAEPVGAVGRLSVVKDEYCCAGSYGQPSWNYSQSWFREDASLADVSSPLKILCFHASHQNNLLKVTTNAAAAAAARSCARRRLASVAPARVNVLRLLWRGRRRAPLQVGAEPGPPVVSAPGPPAVWAPGPPAVPVPGPPVVWAPGPPAVPVPGPPAVPVPGPPAVWAPGPLESSADPPPRPARSGGRAARPTGAGAGGAAPQVGN